MIPLIIRLSENVSLLLSLTFVYTVFADRIRRLPGLASNLITGTILGGFAVLSLLLPTVTDEGIPLDGRDPLLAVTGAVAGPTATITAALLVAVSRVLIGGGATLTDVGHSLVAALLGIGLHLYLRRSGRPLNHYWLFALGLLLIPNTLLWLYLPTGTNLSVSSSVIAPIAVVCALGTLLLGTLLHRHERQSEVESALRRSERQFRAVFNSSFQFIALLKPDGTRLAINQTLLDFGGLRPDKVIGRPLWEADWWEHAPEIKTQLQAAVASAAQGEPARVETTIRRADNSIRTNDLTIKPIQDENGQIVMLIAEGRDLTERKLLEQHRLALELERQQGKLLRSFVTNISHDFKTPLSIILLNVELLRRTSDAEKRGQRLDTLQLEGRRLDRLLNDMLLMLRLDSDYSLSTLRPLDVGSLARSVFERHEPAGLARKLEMRFTPAPRSLTILGDQEDLARAIGNLVENAISFTRDGGKITVSVSGADDQASIDVRDTGIGISANDLPHIYERFYRADKARSTETGGAGLGLSITRRIVELHGGAVEAESQLGCGSSFRMTLPLWNPPAEFPDTPSSQ